jgi:hypothetical protein
LTFETPDLRPFIPEALDLVGAVSKVPFWLEARAGAEVLVEVPFAVRPSAPPHLCWSCGSLAAPTRSPGE